uniref:Uncharacterized protein n=1 Tax=Bionectria ochroleuca TaxID=29856 RepID=A0A8H7TNY0_BIOOC
MDNAPQQDQPQHHPTGSLDGKPQGIIVLTENLKKPEAQDQQPEAVINPTPEPAKLDRPDQDEKEDEAAISSAPCIDFVTLGMFIIDDIDFAPPKTAVKDILGELAHIRPWAPASSHHHPNLPLWAGLLTKAVIFRHQRRTSSTAGAHRLSSVRTLSVSPPEAGMVMLELRSSGPLNT